MTDTKLTEALKRLRPKVETAVVLEPHGDCQVCTSHARSREGSPTMKVERIKFYLQEIQWKLHNKGGRIPEGKRITETCRTRGCLNPNHLAPLSHSEMIKARGKHKRGAANGRAKLTEEQAAIIKNSRDASASALAKHFGISTSSVRDIWAGINWASLTPSPETPVFETPPPEPKPEEDRREMDLINLTRTDYPHQADLQKLGLHLEAAFIAPLLRRPEWGREPLRWQLGAIERIDYDLEDAGVDEYLAKLIVRTAGFLHVETPPEYPTLREALERPTILQNNRCSWEKRMSG